MIFVDNAVVKAYARNQTLIALSSAEAELTAIQRRYESVHWACGACEARLPY